jgi:hypothetical protein
MKSCGNGCRAGIAIQNLNVKTLRFHEFREETRKEVKTLDFLKP